MKKSILTSAIIAFSLVSASATTIFSSGLENGDGWTVTENGDTSVMFGFDYSTMGIPSAPNGTGTEGVRLASNISPADPGGGSAIAISPGISVSGRYTVQFDFWLNYHINGSTEEGGGAVGFTPSAGPLSGTGFRANTDGDAGTDYKLFAAGAVLGIDTGMYAVPSLDAQDGSNSAAQAAFPSQTAPDAQGTGYSNPDGTMAFGWHTMLIDVDGANSTASFSVDGFDFGTITDAEVAGDIALIHTDPFGSVAGNADLAFGVYDNLVVTQVPEPTTGFLALLAAGLMAIRRRR